MERISTKTDVTRVGDEAEPWDEFLAGERSYDDLPEADMRRAAFFGLVGDDGMHNRPRA